MGLSHCRSDDAASFCGCCAHQPVDYRIVRTAWRRVDRGRAGGACPAVARSPGFRSLFVFATVAPLDRVGTLPGRT